MYIVRVSHCPVSDSLQLSHTPTTTLVTRHRYNSIERERVLRRELSPLTSHSPITQTHTSVASRTPFSCLPCIEYLENVFNEFARNNSTPGSRRDASSHAARAGRVPPMQRLKAFCRYFSSLEYMWSSRTIFPSYHSHLSYPFDSVMTMQDLVRCPFSSYQPHLCVVIFSV